ncbi:cytochrome P450 [Actinokineospora inagensis]|uniref:cytochrome P450 n=1 Tax=Actinokineospora inagensis TaxID=103730 RepID=UPI00041B2664|nr:cytochrome P450 [Actinokineospora inagensis]
MTTTDIPVAPGALPLLGHALSLMRDPLGLLESLPRHGDLVAVRLGPVRAVVVCGADLADQVLRDDHVFDKGGPFWDRVREFAGNGLSSCPHALHRRQRRLVQPAFHADRLPGYAEVMAREAGAVAETWTNGAPLDVLDGMMDITSRTVAVTMFSDALTTSELKQALADVSTLMTGLYHRMMRPAAVNNLPTPGNRGYHQATDRLRGVLDNVVANRRANPNKDRGDLLSALLASDLDDGLTDELVTFFIAGTETAASCLTWTLHLLATRPDLQERVRAEADQVLAAGTAPGHETLTGRVITESLRRWPPVWMFTRTTSADTELAGHRIPAGTAVVVSPYLLHLRDDVYPRGDEFDPDRWIDRQPPRTAYIPFSSGARKCVGTQYALTEIAIALTTILRHWYVTPTSSGTVRAVPAATLRPKDLRLRLTAVARLPDQRQPPAQVTKQPDGGAR